MNNTEIQIQFPRPGEWDKFTMTAIYPDAEGYAHVDCYAPEDIPMDQAPALAAAVSAIANLGEDWQASQVWARLREDREAKDPTTEEETIEVHESVLLTVEAVNSTGGRRICLPSEYKQFVLEDPSAVAFFKYFTTQRPESGDEDVSS